MFKDLPRCTYGSKHGRLPTTAGAALFATLAVVVAVDEGVAVGDRSTGRRGRRGNSGTGQDLISETVDDQRRACRGHGSGRRVVVLGAAGPEARGSVQTAAMVLLVGGSRRRLSVAAAGLVIVETGHRRRQVVVVHLAFTETEGPEKRVRVLGRRGRHGRASGDGLISSAVKASGSLEERVDS